MKIEKIKDIEFFNRESETGKIVNILKFKPRLINFIYGPINSGKTSLIGNLIEDLPEDYVVFYINLRGKFISNYKDFVESLFEVDRDAKKKKSRISEFTKSFLSGAGKYYGIPVTDHLLDMVFKDNEPGNVFEYITKVMNEVKKNKKQPILIIDELQVIGDLKIDDYLIYRLFNFFIRLTKELHLCHVFALSSDSLFIEKVYSEAMLQERCEYLLIDEFDLQTTKKFLGKYDFGDEEQNLVFQSVGGKPMHLVTAIHAKISGTGLKETAKRLLKIRKGQVEEVLYSLKDEDKKMFDEVTDILWNFGKGDKMKYVHVSRGIRFLTKQNILFVDPIEKIIKPQSKIDLIAIREVLKELQK